MEMDSKTFHCKEIAPVQILWVNTVTSPIHLNVVEYINLRRKATRNNNDLIGSPVRLQTDHTLSRATRSHLTSPNAQNETLR